MGISTEQAFAEQVVEKTEYRIAEQAVNKYIIAPNINPVRNKAKGFC